MAKSELTLQVEKALYYYCLDLNQFPVEEVSISRKWGMVDMLSFEYGSLEKTTWRCFEIKVSKSDFYSPAKKSFFGQFNYYVMPFELYDVVKKDIPDYVGVLAFDGEIRSVKKAKRMTLQVKEIELVRRLVGSMSREVQKAKLVEKGLSIYSSEELLKELKRRGDSIWIILREQMFLAARDEEIESLRHSAKRATEERIATLEEWKNLRDANHKLLKIIAEIAPGYTVVL